MRAVKSQSSVEPEPGCGERVIGCTIWIRRVWGRTTFVSHRGVDRLVLIAVLAGGMHIGKAQTSQGATFGDVVRLPGGTPSDIVLDEQRHRLYLVNNNTNLVY